MLGSMRKQVLAIVKSGQQSDIWQFWCLNPHIVEHVWQKYFPNVMTTSWP